MTLKTPVGNNTQKFIQWTFVTMTVFVPQNNAIKMNLLLYRIHNEQTDM